MSGRASRICAVALAAIAFAALLPAQTSAAPRPAPAFTLELLDGKTWSLADAKGSPLILLFWAPW